MEVKRVFARSLLAMALLWLISTLDGSFAACTVRAQSCVPPPAGLVSWWPGEGNGSDIVDGNNGTLFGGIGFTTGMVGQAFQLDGSSGYVNVGNASNLHVSSGDFTVDAWVKFNSVAGDQSIVDKMQRVSTQDNEDGWRLLKQTDNRFWFCLGRGAGNNGCAAGGPTTVRSSTSAATGVWYHVAAVKSANTLSLYVNGTVEDSKAIGATYLDSNTTPLLIGSLGSSTIGQTAYFNGLIDEVEIFSSAVSATDIQAIYNAGSAGKCTTTSVDIDIKPGSHPNSINLRSNGVIPVAILTTVNFDAASVDPQTVEFGPDGATEVHETGHLQDVDGDGDLDLVLHFDVGETGIQCGNTTATLSGETFGGTPIEGSDSVNIVKC